MRLVLVTDAWAPQVNGVVRTLERLVSELDRLGVATTLITPQAFRTLPLPFYREIRLALASARRVAALIESARADHVHIATEGPLGWLARRHCRRRGIVFTTSYHTRFPEYAAARTRLPLAWLRALMLRFHNAGDGTLVAAPSLAAELKALGFSKVRPWSRGVDAGHFRPDRRRDLGLPRPVFLNVGRVAVEKNLPAFLDLDLPGTKLVVGDGPDLALLRARYPDVVFAGMKTGVELAELYASADVFVFPSRTDTFGNVLLEALASGLPVAAYPVTGPLDVLAGGKGGVLDEDLRAAAMAALQVSREETRRNALAYRWDRCAERFLAELRRAHDARGASAQRCRAPGALVALR